MPSNITNRQTDLTGAALSSEAGRGMPQPGRERPRALVLFDIDGTLIRRAGPHHRQALVEAVRRTTGLETTTENVPVQGMLDRDILTVMLSRAGASQASIRRNMPELIHCAQQIYETECPNLRQRVCPGARMLLWRLYRREVPVGLVTGNLTRIGWKKMDRAGLRRYFRFGLFAEQGKDRAGLVRLAIRQARRENWIAPDSVISLIGDHPNDVRAAQINGIRAIAVATGIASAEELAASRPDVLVTDLRALSIDFLLDGGPY
ncbi:MAG TPA: HAD hydrolase-like protein [Bryobacteraceae bacterium]|nr:HAD hydrolase-like protein [Bryobacteraceae bacterium]